MALRTKYVHDGGIVERRLRPIYDWLDIGNNKKALQEAEKVLKKSATLQSARALKALALLRLGKSSEAHAVLDLLANEKPSDDTTLQAMTISYRESQQLHKVCNLYEEAVKADPSSEELKSHLFMSYVRIADYKSQQRAAMALYKFQPKNPYYFWAVMSVYLQATETDDQTKKGILLTLAQRMVDNFITENKIEAEQETTLYIMILKQQEKWEDILKFMETPLYTKLLPGSMPAASIPYLKQLNQWSKLYTISKGLILENQDRWDYYTTYFDAAFEMMKTGEETPEKCYEFICTVVESMGGRLLRGPYLARLELWRRLSVSSDPSGLMGSARALCLEYLRLFSTKPCVVSDLRQYIVMIPLEERQTHCNEFLFCVKMKLGSEPESPPQIQCHINALGLWGLCSPLPDANNCEKLGHLFRKHYIRLLDKNLLTSNTTESCAADSYALLAAHYYFYAAREWNNSNLIIEGLCMLELLLHKSPSNFHGKLLLMRLYHILGNASAADKVYATLEVKHVQLVSLGWVHTACLAPSLLYTRALQLLADTRAFHHHHNKDSMEHLTYSYKYGTFEKLIELSAWRDRLIRCVWREVVDRDAVALATVAGPGNAVRPSELVDRYTDNRDLNVIISFEPPQLSEPSIKERTHYQDIAYAKLKHSLVKSIAITTEIASNVELIDESRRLIDELYSCIDVFVSDIDSFKTLYSKKERLSVSTPFTSRIVAFVTSPVPYRDIYPAVLKLVAEINKNKTLAEETIDNVKQLLTKANEILKSSINEKMNVEDPVWNVREMLEELSNYIEFLSIATHTLTVSHTILTTTTKGKKKKTNHTTDQPEVHKQLNSITEVIKNSFQDLEILFSDWPHYSPYSTLEFVFSKLKLEGYECPVGERLLNGREDMLTDVLNVVKKKIKHLKGLIL